VALAARRVRRTSEKYERVKDTKENAQIQRQALKVVLKGSSVSLVIIVLAMLIP